MKLLAFVGGPRAGLDFLQSLFDGHPEVSQFPGYFNFGELLKKIEKQNQRFLRVRLHGHLHLKRSNHCH